MLLTVGATRLNGTDGIVRVRGRPQILLEWGPLAGDLMLTMNLYGREGRHIARLRRNDWTFNDRERFGFERGGRGFTLVDAESNGVVLRAEVVGPDSVVILEGTFRSADGTDIEIVREFAPDAPRAS